MPQIFPTFSSLWTKLEILFTYVHPGYHTRGRSPPPWRPAPTKGNSDYILHFWIPPSFRGHKRENSRINSADDKKMTKCPNNNIIQRYSSGLFLGKSLQSRFNAPKLFNFPVLFEPTRNILPYVHPGYHTPYMTPLSPKDLSPLKGKIRLYPTFLIPPSFRGHKVEIVD